ncbi:MAG: rhodanese-like domain-containing protein [Rhizobiaceae bacterium]
MRKHLGINPGQIRRGVMFLAIVAIVVVIAVMRPEAQTGANVIAADQAYEMAQNGELVIIDIRTPGEWRESGVAEPALQLSMPADVTEAGFLAKFNAIKDQNPGKNVAIICATGGRSGWMHAELEKNGMGGTLNISEGMFGNELGEGWIKRGLPVRPSSL